MTSEPATTNSTALAATAWAMLPPLQARIDRLAEDNHELREALLWIIANCFDLKARWRAEKALVRTSDPNSPLRLEPSRSDIDGEWCI
jgi:hypothetical protein